MILDAVLLSVAKIAAERNTDTSAAIFPKMRLPTEDGVCITNRNTNFQAWLTGTLDYCVLQYPNQDDNKVRFLGEDASRDGILPLACGQLLLVEAKGTSDKIVNMSEHMPKAIGQAIALSEIAGQDSVRFCLSNGRSWIFATLVKDDTGQRTFYEATPRYLNQNQNQIENATSQECVQEIVELVLQWLSPTISSESLYEFRTFQLSRTGGPKVG
ncbi:hypothetical protein FB451DRAFT_100880 [Mycena latifolia]|nr:hypothetical protein FB451DRAFT_100880 [Mycena latifolia]